MDRICIFVDGSNFYFQLKEMNSSAKIDYLKLFKALTNPSRKLIRTYYYVCPPGDSQSESYHSQQKFFSYLKNTPYLQLNFGNLEDRGDTQVEKGVDVRLAVDMVSLAYTNAYDTAILVSNDGDLAPAVETVKTLGKHVEYAYLSKKTVLLAESCDIAVEIDNTILKKAVSR